jgi:hypothetical protein
VGDAQDYECYYKEKGSLRIYYSNLAGNIKYDRKRL